MWASISNQLQGFAGFLLQLAETLRVLRETHVVTVGRDEGLDALLAGVTGQEVREAGLDNL